MVDFLVPVPAVKRAESAEGRIHLMNVNALEARLEGVDSERYCKCEIENRSLRVNAEKHDLASDARSLWPSKNAEVGSGRPA